MKELINISEFPQHLKTLTETEWNELFNLLPEIQKTKSFGEIKISKRKPGEIQQFPFYTHEEITIRLVNTLYKLNLLPVFDWMDWDEGTEILRNESTDYNRFDKITLCKLLTTIIRADRFNDGYLVFSLRDGTVGKILQSLELKVRSTS